eukprot:scaffold26559_cov22-Tisochrysis_lutea.AAC.1
MFCGVSYLHTEAVTLSKSRVLPQSGSFGAARIAEARAAISDVKRGKDEDISVQELLAEGSFGKVYRGGGIALDIGCTIWPAVSYQRLSQSSMQLVSSACLKILLLHGSSEEAS